MRQWQGMGNLLILLWILAYSFCGLNLFLGFMVFQRTKDRKVLGFLAILANNLLVAIAALSGILLELETWPFLFLMFDAVLLYYLTVPYLLLQYLEASALYRRIVLAVGVWILAANGLILVLPDSLYAMFSAYPLPLLALFLFSFLRGRRMAQRGTKIRIFRFWENVANCVVFTIVLAMILSGGYFVVLAVVPEPGAFLPSLYFSSVIHLYNVPALFLFLNHLRQPIPTAQGKDWDSVLKRMKLSPREREVAILLINGSKYEEVCDRLFISLSTVKRHAYNIYQKTDVNNSRQLMQKAIQLMS